MKRSACGPRADLSDLFGCTGDGGSGGGDVIGGDGMGGSGRH